MGAVVAALELICGDPQAQTSADAVQYSTSGAGHPYVHSRAGRSVVVDDATGEVIHVGGDGFEYRD